VFQVFRVLVRWGEIQPSVVRSSSLLVRWGEIQPPVVRSSSLAIYRAGTPIFFGPLVTQCVRILERSEMIRLA